MIPKPYQQMHQLYPEYMQAYEAFGDAARQAGPLSPREIALVKLAISVGAGLEGAAHSHCRKAIEAGCTADDLRHVALVSAPTIGFPTMMRARGWIEDVVARGLPVSASSSARGAAATDPAAEGGRHPASATPTQHPPQPKQQQQQQQQL